MIEACPPSSSGSVRPSCADGVKDCRAATAPCTAWDSLGPWAIWLVMTGLAFGLVAVAGLRLPYADEWRWLPVLAGNQELSGPWLLQFDNEHRIILPKLVYMALVRLTADFRAGGFFSVAVLSVAAAVLLIAVRRARGGNRLADGVFPLVLLQWAQSENLLWGLQIHFVLSVGLIVLVLALVFRLGESLGTAAACGVAGCLLAAGLCGPYALAFFPPLACWLAYAAIATGRRRGDGRRSALRLALFAVALIATVPLLRLGHSTAADQIFPAGIAPEDLTLSCKLRTSLQFLANAFGPATKQFWPVSGVLALAACAISAAHLLVAIRLQPERRLRAAGMLAMLAGVVSVSFAIGWARAFLGATAGFESRYVTLALPLVCLFYLQCQAFANRRTAQIQNGLFALMCVLAVFDAFKGLRLADDLQAQCAALRQDVRSGIPASELSERYVEENFVLARTDEFAGWLEILRDRGWYPYDSPGARTDLGQAICPMIELPRTLVAPGKVRLTAGQQWRQRFSPRQEGHLWRIDVQLTKWRWLRTVDEFVWRLREADAPASAPSLAEGHFDFRQCKHYRWATLLVPSLPVAVGRELELILELPAEGRSQRYLEIPLADPCAPSSRPKMSDSGKPEHLVMAGNASNVDSENEGKIGILRAMLFLRLSSQSAQVMSLPSKGLFH